MRALALCLALLTLLAACQWALPQAKAPAQAPAAQGAASPSVAPPPQPKKRPDPPEAAPAAPPMISAAQAQCLASKGQWTPLEGSSGHICLHVTRDPGKSCRRKSDCQGECLAQSRSCSPITPLMGCNAILQADGTEVTLCLQ